MEICDGLFWTNKIVQKNTPFIKYRYNVLLTEEKDDMNKNLTKNTGNFKIHFTTKLKNTDLL